MSRITTRVTFKLFVAIADEVVEPCTIMKCQNEFSAVFDLIFIRLFNVQKLLPSQTPSPSPHVNQILHVGSYPGYVSWL